MNIHGVCHDVSQMLMVLEDGVVALNRVIVKQGAFLACCIETCDIFAFFRRTQTKKVLQAMCAMRTCFPELFCESGPKAETNFYNINVLGKSWSRKEKKVTFNSWKLNACLNRKKWHGKIEISGFLKLFRPINCFKVAVSVRVVPCLGLFLGSYVFCWHLPFP